jgi:hypothetical protein
MFKKIKNYFLNKIKSLKRFQSKEKIVAARLERKIKAAKNCQSVNHLEQFENSSYIPLREKSPESGNQASQYHNIDDPWQEEY